jgi:hypothetical protein
VSWFVQGRRPDLPLPMARRTRAFVPNPSRPSSWAHITEAIENHRMPDPGRFRSLVVLFYKASSDYAKLAGSTRKNWSPWLDRIADSFGGLRVAHFDRLEKIPPGGATNGPISRAWPIMECKFYSRVLSHAADPLGKIAGNPIKQLYSADRSEVIWTDSDIALSKRRARRKPSMRLTLRPTQVCAYGTGRALPPTKCRIGAVCSATPASSAGHRLGSPGHAA